MLFFFTIDLVVFEICMPLNQIFLVYFSASYQGVFQLPVVCLKPVPEPAPTRKPDQLPTLVMLAVGAAFEGRKLRESFLIEPWNPKLWPWSTYEEGPETLWVEAVAAANSKTHTARQGERRKRNQREAWRIRLESFQHKSSFTRMDHRALISVRTASHCCRTCHTMYVACSASLPFCPNQWLGHTSLQTDTSFLCTKRAKAYTTKEKSPWEIMDVFLLHPL